MEIVSIEFFERELELIKSHELKNETISETIKGLISQLLNEIPNNVWKFAVDEIFEEFDETFQKLAE
jgi:hypothetical protein